VLVLLVPDSILAVPDVRERNYPAVIAYVAITGLLITLGSGFLQLNHALDAAVAHKALPQLGSTADLLKTSAYFAFTAAAVWYIMARDVYRITGVSRTSHPYNAR
jgi:formate hydrogenlyase subunit 3/multisubunit Na+/H+ antiporter MnhD subunit